jgi:EmrB/QacA subfamily drug resistance transporter
MALREDRIIPLVVASALFMENLDSTVIATSLPAIALDLHQDPVILKLAFTSYLLSLAVFIPISGWCADRFGARRVFRVAIAIFTLASIGCGFAQSLEGLVVARALQGLGGALMVPVGRLIVLRLVPKRELLNALAYLTVPALIGPLAGPPLGGFITTYFHWRWIFWINVPFGILGIYLETRFIPRLKAEVPDRFDFTGFVLVGLGLSTTVFGVTMLSNELLPAYAAPLLVLAGSVLMALYVAHGRRIRHAILDLDLFRIATFRASVIGGSLFRIGVGALPFLLPLLLQLGFGLTPFQSGLLTFAAAAGAMSMKFVARPVLQRYGFKRVLVANAIVGSMFLGVNSLLSAATPHLLILAIFLAGGFFRSLQFTSINALGYSDVPETLMSRASTLYNVIQQLSLSFGVAAAAGVLEFARGARAEPGLTVHDMQLAFVIVALVSASSALVFLRLDPGAGHAVSGHGKVPPDTGTPNP